MLKVNISNREYAVNYKQNGQLTGQIDGEDFDLDILKKTEDSYHLIKDNNRSRARINI